MPGASDTSGVLDGSGSLLVCSDQGGLDTSLK